MRRRVDDLLVEREVPGPLVDVRDDGLVFLREQRDEVHVAVVIQVDREHMDAARRAGRSVCFVNAGWVGTAVVFSMNRDSPVFRHPNAATSEIVAAVAVEVSGFDIGDARPSVEPEGAELAVGESAQPDDRALVVIGREELAEIADEQILDAVLVDIGEGDVSRVRNAGDVRQRRTVSGRAAREHEAEAHVGREQTELLVTAEMHQLHVRHRG